MTTYTFVGNPSNTNVLWTTPSVWSTDTVPNDPTAIVVIPAISLENNPHDPYVSTINIPVSIDIEQLYLAGNELDVIGALTVGGEFEIGAHGALHGQSLTVGGALVLSTASFIAFSGTLHAGSVQNDGLIQHGTIVDAGAFLNQAGGVVEGTGQTITAASFDNLGQLNADTGNLAIDAPAFSNLSGSTLTGGQYEAGAGLFDAPNAFDLDLNVGGILTTDAAQITLTDGSDMAFYNSAQSAYRPIEATLKNIASSGVLTLVNMSDTWGALTIDGQLVLEASTLGAAQLTINSDGGVQGYGTVNAPIVDNGVLTAGLTGALLNQAFPLGLLEQPPALDLTGAVTGSGKIEIAPTAQNVDNGLPEPWTLELSAAATAEVAFSDENGLLILADVAQFTGSIAPADYLQQTGKNTGDDQIELPGIGLVTSYDYARTADGGTLTLHVSVGSSVSLRFVGQFDTQSFTLGSAGPLSSSPSLLITVANEATAPRDDFLGQGLSDILLENSSGQVDVGQLTSGAFALTKVDTLGSQWKFVGDGDFLGAGVDQIAIENAAGAVGIGRLSGGSLHLATAATGLPATTKFVEVGDFLNHGNDQFLVETASGQVEIGSVSGGAVSFAQIDTLGSQWSIVGAGDYLGDGHDQFLIENTAGNVGLAQMVGGALHVQTIDAGLTGWKILESGDFLGDGKADFLLEDPSNGSVNMREVTGSSATITVVGTLASQWTFVGAGDYLGDGRDQVLIENSTGSLGIGEVSGGKLHFTTVATGFGEWMFH